MRLTKRLTQGGGDIRRKSAAGFDGRDAGHLRGIDDVTLGQFGKRFVAGVVVAVRGLQIAQQIDVFLRGFEAFVYPIPNRGPGGQILLDLVGLTLLEPSEVLGGIQDRWQLQ